MLQVNLLTGRYWDFSNAKKGEMVNSSEVYECTSSDWEKFDKFMSSIWKFTLI